MFTDASVFTSQNTPEAPVEAQTIAKESEMPCKRGLGHAPGRAGCMRETLQWEHRPEIIGWLAGRMVVIGRFKSWYVIGWKPIDHSSQTNLCPDDSLRDGCHGMLAVITLRPFQSLSDFSGARSRSITFALTDEWGVGPLKKCLQKSEVNSCTHPSHRPTKFHR